MFTAADSKREIFVERELEKDVQDTLTNILEEEINLLHLSEKKSSHIVTGDNEDEEEDEEMPDVADYSPETRGVIHEKRVCELAGRLTLAVLAGVMPKSFAQTLQKFKGKVGHSYDKLILELEPEKAKEKPKVKPKEKLAPVEEPKEPEEPKDIFEAIEVTEVEKDGQAGETEG